MTEAKIFEILLEKQYDFPKLDATAASTIANSFTDIIYDTLKLKSSLPTSRRLNVLKFLKTLSSGNDAHVSVNETKYHNFIAACQQCDCEGFLNNVKSELDEQIPADLSIEIERFYDRKNERRQRKNKKRELIKKHDQEALTEANFPGKIQRSMSYYETNRNMIQKLIPNTAVLPTKSKTVDVTDLTYREKQIKFAYSLLYLREWIALRKVLERLITYKTLSRCETNFLTYLNENTPEKDQNLRQFLANNFPFIYEKPIITFCTRLIQLPEGQLFDYLETLLLDKEFIRIKELCRNETFKSKLKHLLLELYTRSYCNPHILKFLDFLL